MERIKILGVGVDPVDEKEALAQCSTFIAEGGSHFVFTPNSEMIMNAREDKALFAALQKADLVVPDGMGVVWASKILGTPLKERVTGIDLFLALCKEASYRGWKIFLLGSKPTVAEEAREKLIQNWPDLKIVGTQHGYFTEQQEAEVLRKIGSSSPDILAVGLGSPRQELWLLEHLPDLGVPLGLGIGGSFDVVSGQKKRAPKALSHLGLEWAWRLAKEPGRLPRMMALPKFALRVIGERLGGGKNR
jgi:N-acetylglucosaminyldiphosphoundecaprenol N-acetyl-beta-D-mannosaminyltransferase